jgi:hypothetical protein
MSRGVQVARVIFSSVALFLLWALLTSGFKAQESLMGAFAALVGSSVYLLLRRKTGFTFQPRMGELLQAWRLPWYLLSGSWMITQVLFLDLLGIRRAGSFYRATSFDSGNEQPARQITRRTLATAFTTVSPDFIIIGVDTERKQMLFHQILRTDVPKMTKNLGARG